MKEIIENIHDSDSYGVIVEIGAGLPISNLLFSVAGASKTIHCVESPYSRESFDKRYPTDSKVRAVSAERLGSVRNMSRIEMDFKNNYNFVLATSFQVGHKNENNFSSHGWIMLGTKKDTKYYHLSLHEPLTREEYIKIIGETGVQILNGGYFENSYIDIVLNEDFSYDLDSTLEFLSRNTLIDQMSVFKRDGTIDRLETVTRSDNEIVLFKGSFNPPTIKHLDIIENVLSKFKLNKSDSYFLISINTVDKGIIDIKNLIKRIYFINKLGYDCIITNNGHFQSNIDFIRNKFKGKLLFPVGSDTIDRMENTLFENEDVIFEIFERDENISSTKIRNAIKKCDINSVLDIIPNEIIDLL